LNANELHRGVGNALQNIHKNSNERGIAADFIATNSANIFAKQQRSPRLMVRPKMYHVSYENDQVNWQHSIEKCLEVENFRWLFSLNIG
jgi:predicted DNA-binding ArsR family transcriptional regulator